MAVAPIGQGPVLTGGAPGPLLSGGSTKSPEELQAFADRMAAATSKVIGNQGQGNPSLWDQFSNVVSGLPSGILHMGVDAAKDVQGIGRAINDAWINKEGTGNDATDYFPLLTGIGASMKETGKDIIHPSRLVDAYNNGTIVSKVLEDVGNAAIVLGPAAKGLGAAAGTEAGVEAAARSPLLSKIANVTPEAAKPMLAPVARGLEHVVAPVERAASAPARIWTAPTKLVTGFDLPTRVFGTAEDGAAHHVGLGPALLGTDTAQKIMGSAPVQAAKDSVVKFLDDRAKARDVQDNALRPATAGYGVWANKIDKMMSPARRILGDNADLEHANHLIHSAMFPLVERAVEFGKEFPEHADEVLKTTFGRGIETPDGTFDGPPSPQAQQVVVDYVKGVLDPKIKDKLDRAWGYESKALNDIQAVKLEGVGRTNPLDPAQLGDAPIQDRIDYRMQRLNDQADQARIRLHGDPNNLEDNGLYGKLTAAQAKIPVANTADLVSETAQARARRAGALSGEQALLGKQADTAEAQAARLGERVSAQSAKLGPEAVQRLVDRGVTARLERQVPRTLAADEQLAGRAGAAETARGKIAGKAEAAQQPLTPADGWTASQAPSLGEAARQVRDVRAQVRDQMVETRRGIESRIVTEGSIAVPPPGSAMRDVYDQIQGVLAEGSSGTRGRFRNMTLADEAGGTRPLFSAGGGVRGVDSGIPLDEFLSAYARRVGTTELTAAQSLLDDLRSIKEMKGAESGVVQHGFDGQTAQAFAANQIEGAALVGTVEDAARAVIDAHHETLLPRPAEGLAPWEMTREQFVNEVQGAQAAYEPYLRVPFDQWGPEAFAAEQRLLELIPQSLGSAADDLGVLHDRALELAQRAGYDVAHPPLHAPFVESGVGAAAVDAAHLRAQDAFDADEFNRQMAAEDNIPVNQSILQRPSLSAPEKAIYDEMMAAKAAEAQQARLAAERAATVGTAHESGVRAGQAVGQLEGKQALLAKQADVAGTRVETLEPRIVQAEQSAQTAEQQAAGQAVRFGEQRGKQLRDAQLLAEQVRRQERQLARLENERIPTERAKLEQGPVGVTPGKYVPPQVHAERFNAAVHAVADQILETTGDTVAASRVRVFADAPTTMFELQARLDAAGAGYPEYIPGAIDNPTKGGASIAGSGDQLPYFGRTPSERGKSYGHIPQRITTVQRQLSREMQAVMRNESAMLLQDNYAHSVARVLGTMLDEGRITEVDYRHLMDGTYDRTNGIARIMEQEGFRGWDPKSVDGRTGDQRLRPDSLVMPAKIMDQFQRWWKPNEMNPALKFYDTATRSFKHSVLAMSPQWHIYNILGNTFMATAGAGETPWAIYRYAKEAKAIMAREAATGVAELPAQLKGAGHAAEIHRGMAENGTKIRGLESRAVARFGEEPAGRGAQFAVKGAETLSHPIASSYAMNEAVDNLGRSAVYLAKRAKGFSEEEAVKLALQAMGDFANLRPWEKNFMRRVVPFYAWAKHVTKATFHLAVDHPFRTAWMLHMADMFNSKDDLQGMPGWVQDSVSLGGGWFLPLDGSNPYANSVGSLFTSPKDWPTQFFRSLNPLIKLGGSAVGLNLGSGRLNTRPKGSGALDDYGRPMLSFESPLTDLYMAARIFPQGRLLTDALQDPVVRYDTGQPVLSHGRTLPIAGGRLPMLIRDLGVPYPRLVDVQGTQARIAKAQAAAAKARATYNRQAPSELLHP